MSNPFPLGRLLRHDEHSKDFQARVAQPSTVMYTRHGRVLDQGQLGSCTGNATVHALNFDPNFKAAGMKRSRNESNAVKCYSLATELDGLDGTYPPDDNGSSGLGAAQAAKKLKWITGYTHAFGLDHLIGALAVRPVIVGTNWYEGMFEPDGNGTVGISGAVAGGHEYCINGIDMENHVFRAINSWGEGWGKKGYFFLAFSTMDRLLSEDGDVTVLIP
jgi:hypothetical protein